MQHCHNMNKRVTAEDHSTVLDMLHQNSITQVPIYEADNENYWKFCPTGIDGAMIIWDFKTLESSIQGLQII